METTHETKLQALVVHALAASTVVWVTAGCSMEIGEPPVGSTRTGELSIATDDDLQAVDADGDGIDDGYEDRLLQRHAPVVYLHLREDWTRPGNVPWTLDRVRMRMHHNNCRDTQIAYYPSVDVLLGQAYRRKTLGWWGCSREDPIQYSNGSWHRDDHYFLQYVDDSYHSGPSDPSQWIVYGHVYPADSGYWVQYWFYYPYNDWFSSANHEGDWEHINVRLGADETVLGVLYAFHNDTQYVSPNDVTWWDRDHPVVFSADGSHASYPRGATSHWSTKCYDGFWEFDDHCAGAWETDNRWFTGAGMKGTEAGMQGGGVVNVGERSAPHPGYEWIQYSGRWGEKGEFDSTSGPRGPAYQSSWNYDRASTSSGGTSGGSGSCTSDDLCLEEEA